jgi:hypothetical protein
MSTRPGAAVEEEDASELKLGDGEHSFILGTLTQIRVCRPCKVTASLADNLRLRSAGLKRTL